jgi:acetyl esterase
MGTCGHCELMADYSALLDDEVWAFLNESARYYPDDAVGLSITEQRALYNKMCVAFDQGRPSNITVEDLPFGGVPCRVYSPTDTSYLATATVFFCHGGGFVVGGLDSHDSVCAEFCAITGLRVIAVDYRLSPEHPHPDDFDDAWAAFEAVCVAFEGAIVMCGDSAGGNLVAAVTHHARGRIDGRITGQLLIYPGLGGDQSKGSYITHAQAPGLTKQDMEFYMNIRSAGQDKFGDPTYAPLHDKDFTNLPATVIITAECDPLSDDGKDYRDAMLAAGGEAIWINETGLVHAYLRARVMSSKAGASFGRMTQSLSALAKSDLPKF